jgi:hypothetical protein
MRSLPDPSLKPSTIRTINSFAICITDISLSRLSAESIGSSSLDNGKRISIQTGSETHSVHATGRVTVGSDDKEDCNC